jgi:hypothetical protein
MQEYKKQAKSNSIIVLKFFGSIINVVIHKFCHGFVAKGTIWQWFCCAQTI